MKHTKRQRCLGLVQVENDPSERENLAELPEYQEHVEHLAAALASYTAYVDGNMTAEELEPYECVEDPTDYWHNFAGPCCKKKAGGGQGGA